MPTELKQPSVKSYGAFLALTQAKKSKPGDGSNGRGVKGGSCGCGCGMSSCDCGGAAEVIEVQSES